MNLYDSNPCNCKPVETFICMNQIIYCRHLKLVAYCFSLVEKDKKNIYYKHEKEIHCCTLIVEKGCVGFKAIINIDKQSKLYNYM